MRRKVGTDGDAPPPAEDEPERGRFVLERVRGAPVSDSALLDDLRRVAAEVGGNTIGQKLYRERGRYADTTLSGRFGTWNKALAAAGLALSNRVNYPDEELFENLFTLWTHFGRQPRRHELAQAPSRITQSPYLRRFDSWTAALESFVRYANADEREAPAAEMEPVRLRRTGREPSLRLRFRVFQRDGFRCRACGASPATTPGVELAVDHVVAWSNGGETTPENLQTLCSRCNGGKGAM